MAQHTRPRAWRRWSVRSLAGWKRIRLLVRLPGWRGKSMEHAALREHRAHRAAARQPEVAFHRSDGGAGDLLDRPAESGRSGKAVLHLLRAWCLSFTAPRAQGVGR